MYDGHPLITIEHDEFLLPWDIKKWYCDKYAISYANTYIVQEPVTIKCDLISG
jgi:hypothetical protein